MECFASNSLYPDVRYAPFPVASFMPFVDFGDKGFVGCVGVGSALAVVGHGFGLGMFECADAAFLIGAYPSSQVGSGDAVMICGTLLAAYMQVVEYGLVFEV